MTVDTLPLFASNVFVTEVSGDFDFDIKKHRYPSRDGTQDCDYFVLDSYPKVKKLLDLLDDEDDVQRVYSNFREED